MRRRRLDLLNKGTEAKKKGATAVVATAIDSKDSRRKKGGHSEECEQILTGQPKGEHPATIMHNLHPLLDAHFWAVAPSTATILDGGKFPHLQRRWSPQGI